MKKMISTGLLSLAFVLNSMADDRTSDLRIRCYDNRTVLVSLNHEQYTERGNTVWFRGIYPGRHYLQVWGFRHHSYGVHQGRVMLYSGFIDIPSSMEIKATITRNGFFRIAQMTPLQTPVVAPPACVAYPVGPAHCGTPSNQGFEEAEFNALLATLEHQHFESTKLTIARQAIRQKGAIMTHQVIEIMRLMCFESSKLELAKFAFVFTLDNNQYYRVFNEFQFDSSVRELSAFMDRPV